MADCTKQQQVLDEINIRIADLKDTQNDGSGGPIKKPQPGMLGLLRRQQEAKDALRKCLNQPTRGSIFPKYLVTTLLYNPPGIGSETTYGSGSTAGVTVDVTNSFKAGQSISTSGGFFGNGIDASIAFAGGPKSGNSYEVKKESGSVLSLQSQQDQVDHTRDEFIIWTNVRVDVAQTANLALNLGLGIQGGGQSMDMVRLTAAQLRDQSLIPDKKKPSLAKLTPGDYAKILELNPLAGGGSIDPQRFRYIRTFQVSGPDNKGDSIPGIGVTITDEGAKGSISGLTKQLTVGATLETGFNFFSVANANLSLGLTFEWEYETSTNVTAGTKEEATALLRSETVGFSDVIDVYQDMMFKTFAFVSKSGRPTGERPAIMGTVTDTAGRPVSNRQVDIVLPNGELHTAFSNAQGIYRLFAVPGGDILVKVADITKKITLGADLAKVSFQLGAE